MRLPKVVQEISDVIGRDRALYLVGQLPRCTPPSARSANRGEQRVYVYVPYASWLKPDHSLVSILGMADAEKLCRHFGGEILHLGNCTDLYRAFRDAAIVRVVREGVPVKMAAEWFNVSERHVRNKLREKPQEARTVAANDNTYLQSAKAA